MSISDCRKRIDEIDTAILHFLNQRAELAVKVGRFKGQRGMTLRTPAREQQIVSRLKRLNSGPLSDQSVEKIYQAILDESIHTQEVNGCGITRSFQTAGTRLQLRRRAATT
jgi:chorismate mutase